MDNGHGVHECAFSIRNTDKKCHYFFITYFRATDNWKWCLIENIGIFTEDNQSSVRRALSTCGNYSGQPSVI